MTSDLRQQAEDLRQIATDFGEYAEVLCHWTKVLGKHVEVLCQLSADPGKAKKAGGEEKKVVDQEAKDRR